SSISRSRTDCRQRASVLGTASRPQGQRWTPPRMASTRGTQVASGGVAAERRFDGNARPRTDQRVGISACHSCLLVAETSSEARNLFLDRAPIVDTMGQTGATFF